MMFALTLQLWQPSKYTMRGTVRLPLANISEPFAATMDFASKQGYVGYYDNMSYIVWNPRPYHVFYQGNRKNCTRTVNGANDTDAAITTMLPDLTNPDWKAMGITMIRGVNVSHYRLTTTDGTADPNANFIYNVSDYQDYFCIPGVEFENQDYCIPWRWEIHGFNTNSHSHFDFYQIDYDEFDNIPVFTESTFATPEVCKDVKTQKLSGNFLFFQTANNRNAMKNVHLMRSVQQDESITFRVKPNKFLGLSEHEFKTLYTGVKVSAPKPNQKYYQLQGKELPDELDLRVKGIATPVKDQAVCGSCWTFGTAALIEGRINFRNRLNQKPLVRVSEQQILSCTWYDTPERQNLGCNGGEIDLALDQIISQKGGKIPLESISPYLGVESECNEAAWTNKYGTVARSVIIDNTTSVENRIKQLKEALLEGPVGVSIAVIGSMSFYAGGVYNDKKCGYGNEAVLAHAVTCIGWGKDELYGEYWIIKNSWSNAWGMDGYIYISMENDLCGVLQKATLFEFNEQPTPLVENKYRFKGTFSLPYANVTQDIQVWFDRSTKREKISYYDDADYAIWDLTNTTKYYSVLTYLPQGAAESTQRCTLNPTLGHTTTSLVNVFPDLSTWEVMPDTKIMNKVVRHFRLSTTDEGSDEPAVLKANFGYTRADQQDYYCVQNGNLCDPVRWEIHGYNTIFGSHYDYYVLDIDEFERPASFDPKIFQKPEMECFDVPQEQGPQISKWTFALQNLMTRTPTRKQNVNAIKAHAGNFTVAPNRFSDLTLEEFKRQHTGYKNLKTLTYKHVTPFIAPELDAAGKWFVNGSVKQLFPKNLDWRVEGGVPPVRDQANCGSCWAFGTASVIEARVNRLFIGDRYRPLFQMSEQAIVDCVWTNDFKWNSDGLHGCDGGQADGTMDRIIEDFGGKLPRLADYPYMSQDMKCQKNLWTFEDATLTSFSNTKPNNIGELKYALLSGPVTVAIQVTGKMMFYSGGIFDDVDCTNDPQKLDHQVTAVGWGYDEQLKQEYWIVRNSWSNAWGIDGYIYISMNLAFDCGITQATTIPNLQKNK
ncbi:Cathepsin_L [Hexamita inflata]|uniref:Cathepsin L n=1 Tax=Hexamita inflata TaxID=28002 RepID=A0AA86NHE9_9EUKA|nr:Cathepsin L [Hexamita inflata]